MRICSRLNRATHQRRRDQHRCGRRITVTQLAHRMAELCGRPELTPIYKPDRAGDVKHSLADLSRAETLLGYDPITNFEDGLATTMAWYKSVIR